MHHPQAHPLPSPWASTPRRRLFAALLCVAVAWASLSGCGDDGSSANTTRADASTSADALTGEDTASTSADALTGEDTASTSADALTGEDTADTPDTSDTDSPPPKVGCHPIAAEFDCLLPYPSDFFLRDDLATPSGKRVEIAPDALPRYRSGERVNPMTQYPADGFSHHPPILAFWPHRVDVSALPSHADPSPSLLPTSATVLLNADTGEPVLHFSELDMRDKDKDLRRALFVRPMVRLQNGARYIVAIQGLRDADSGDLLPAPVGFTALRDAAPIDASTPDGEALQGLRDDYDQAIFPALDTFGVRRQDLQLAWAFTVESERSVTHDALTMRADAMSRLAASPPVVTIDQVQDGDAVPASMRARIARRVTGTLRTPLYLDGDTPTAALARDSAGQVAYQGDVEVPFTALIPHAAFDALTATGQPVRLLQFGHGFFGTQAEIDNDSSIQRTAVSLSAVLICIDEWGFSTPDLAPLTDNILSNPDHVYAFVDRTLQGYINQLAIGYAARASFAALPALQAPDSAAPLIDASSPVVFYGRSNGQIQGSVYVALSPHIERMVMNVGGASLTFMMSRAFPFSPLLALFNIKLLDPLDIQKVIALSPTVLDRVDPITYAPHLLTDTFEGSPPSRAMLMQIGIGDTSVPNLASHLFARTLGIPLLQPSPRLIPGLPLAQPADATSGLLEVDYGLPAPLPGTLSVLPTDDNFVHGSPSGSTPLRLQAEQFLRPDGVIIHPCDGPCDPN